MVELLVALTAGLVVSASAYLLARNSMRSYQEESRISTSQVAASIGMGRLQADLQRAGYMSSPNIELDPHLCGAVDPADAPLYALRIESEGSKLMDLNDAFDYGGVNEMADPDLIVVSGNMTSTEQFEYRVIDGNGQVFLAMDRGPMQRLIASTGGAMTAIQNVFVPVDAGGLPTGNRFARIVDQTGKESYVLVINATVVTDPTDGVTGVTLTIRNLDGLTTPSLADQTAECGFVQRGAGLINPVSVVRYRIGQLCNPYLDCAAAQYGKALVSTGPDAVTGESVRSELLREEMTPAAVQADEVFDRVLDADRFISREIVAEFAVDLDFAGVVREAGALVLKDFGAAALDYDDPAASPPQTYRSLRVKLSTRARVPDREELGLNDGAFATRFYLKPVDTEGNRLHFARMRTLQTEIQLPNLQGVTW